MSFATSLVRKIRPASLGWQVGQLLGLTAHRIFTLPDGTQIRTSPLGDLGSSLEQGDYEAPTQAVLRKYLRPGDTFIDAGANEGFFTVLAARLVGSEGKVVAIEPQSRLQSVIRTNLELNGCHNTQLLHAGLARQRGSFRLALTPEINTGSSSIYRPTKYDLPEEEVRTITLADLLQEAAITGCQLMKVDIEGAEYDLFLHAGDLLRTGVLRNIALEIHHQILDKQGLPGDQLHQFVLNCGYRLNTQLGPAVYEFAT